MTIYMIPADIDAELGPRWPVDAFFLHGLSAELRIGIQYVSVT